LNLNNGGLRWKTHNFNSSNNLLQLFRIFKLTPIWRESLQYVGNIVVMGFDYITTMGLVIEQYLLVLIFQVSRSPPVFPMSVISNIGLGGDVKWGDISPAGSGPGLELRAHW
jgi:hypothetical protein